MRNELELIQEIEQYLKGEMTPEESAAFEKRLAENAELQEAVALQRDIMAGTERAVFREKVRQAARGFRLRRMWKRAGIAIAAAAVVGLICFYVCRYVSHVPMQRAPLPVQSFGVYTNSDTVIETQGGMVIVIPARCFTDANGRLVQGEVDITVQEALTPADIIKAGLSTLAGSHELETGGMFSIEARQEGRLLKIGEGKEIDIRVPTDSIIPDMKLYKGASLPSGRIDWVNPQPLSSKLPTVDITTLDFYPPLYLDSLAAWGLATGDKRFTDSLYYDAEVVYTLDNSEASRQKGKVNDSDTMHPASWGERSERLFIGYCSPCHHMTKNLVGPALAGVEQRWKDKKKLYAFIRDANAVIASGDVYAKNLFREYNQTVMPALPGLTDEDIKGILGYIAVKSSGGDMNCGIRPLKVKAIWDPRYNNTLLATKAFEERLQIIHKTGDNQLLELYVANLDKEMWEIDSMAALQSRPMFQSRFRQLAARRDGGVALASGKQAKLQAYYARKVELYGQALAKTRAALASTEKARQVKTAAHEEGRAKREQELFIQELAYNLDTAYGKLGKPVNPLPAANTYDIEITSTGWYNIDRMVQQATEDRISGSYADPSTGKTVTITYSPYAVQPQDKETFDRLYVYLLPGELNSFIRLEEEQGIFGYRLNDLFHYRLLAVGWKGAQMFTYAKEDVKPTDTEHITLSPSGEAAFKTFVQRYAGKKATTDILREQAYLKEAYEYNRTQPKLQGLAEDVGLSAAIRIVIFPCQRLPDATPAAAK